MWFWTVRSLWFVFHATSPTDGQIRRPSTSLANVASAAAVALRNLGNPESCTRDT
jgi:hypothetical protein